jgi:hypothetical protein
MWKMEEWSCRGVVVMRRGGGMAGWSLQVGVWRVRHRIGGLSLSRIRITKEHFAIVRHTTTRA